MGILLVRMYLSAGLTCQDSAFYKSLPRCTDTFPPRCIAAPPRELAELPKAVSQLFYGMCSLEPADRPSFRSVEFQECLTAADDWHTQSPPLAIGQAITESSAELAGQARLAEADFVRIQGELADQGYSVIRGVVPKAMVDELASASELRLTRMVEGAKFLGSAPGLAPSTVAFFNLQQFETTFRIRWGRQVRERVAERLTCALGMKLLRALIV